MKPACPPTLGSLYWFLTWRCNLRCRHCWAAATGVDADGCETSELTVSEFSRTFLIARRAGLKGIKLSGGEPLLRLDLLKQAVDLCRETGINFTLETNGTLIDNSTAAMLATVRPHIGVSLDSHMEGFHDDFRGVRGAFKRTIRGIELLVSHGVVPRLIMSVTKDNVGHIAGVIELAKKLGVDGVKINPVSPIGRGYSLKWNLLELEDIAKLNDILQEYRKETSIEITMGGAICAKRPVAVKCYSSY